MPNKRAPGQKLVPIWMNEDFKAAIDACAENTGVSTAWLIRDAVYEKLKLMGHPIPKQITYAPARRGKGGKKK